MYCANDNTNKLNVINLNIHNHQEEHETWLKSSKDHFHYCHRMLKKRKRKRKKTLESLSSCSMRFTINHFKAVTITGMYLGYYGNHLCWPVHTVKS